MPAQSTHHKWLRSIALGGLAGLVAMTGASTAPSADVAAQIKKGITAPSAAAANFGRLNPEFAKRIGDADNIYRRTQGFQDYFLACAGAEVPKSFSCGLANDFYDKIAAQYGLPKNDAQNLTNLRNSYRININTYERLLQGHHVKAHPCISYQVPKATPPFHSKKHACVTVSYPGSVNHFLNKVPDVPGVSDLKKKVRHAFNKAKSEYESFAKGMRSTINTLSDQLHRLDLAQKAIDAENKRVRDKAIGIATNHLQTLIKPALDPLLRRVATEFATDVMSLNNDYLRGVLVGQLNNVRQGRTTQQWYRTAYAQQRQMLASTTQQGRDPLEVMGYGVYASVFNIMNQCMNSPDPAAMKMCTQTRFQDELLTLSADLVHSVYTHTSTRMLYVPCSSQLADDVTTEAASGTYGMSCAGYKTLQSEVEQLMTRVGNGVYDSSIAPFVKSTVRQQLGNSAAQTAKAVVEPIPLNQFSLPNQRVVSVTSCEKAAGRFKLPDGKCIVPLEKSYIYDWNMAEASCKLKGGTLCSKDQVATAVQQGFSWCAYSWTGTKVDANRAYEVLPMSHTASGCGQAGLNENIRPVSVKYSGLCCVATGR